MFLKVFSFSEFFGNFNCRKKNFLIFYNYIKLLRSFYNTVAVGVL